MSQPSAANRVADLFTSTLAPVLGPHTARVAVKTFAGKKLGRAPETLRLGDVPTLVEALRPMLRTFVGASEAEALLGRIEKELNP